MSYGIYVFDLGTQVASADLSSNQYYCGKITASGVALCDTQGEVVDGVIQNDPESGQEVVLRVGGVSQVVANSAIAKGVDVTVGADGKIEAAASGDYIVGETLEASGADGDIISLLITRPGRVA
jgi:hypothetical protein